MPLPIPTDKTANEAKINLNIKLSGAGINFIERSIIKAIINAFNIVPIPGFCFKKIHKNKTAKLIKNVIVPIERSICRDIPWARTLHGEAPVEDTISKPSPKPNNDKPKHKKNRDEIFGLKFKGLSELQYTFGMLFIDKNINLYL